MYRRILIGYDGGDQSRDAVTLGQKLAERTERARGARVFQFDPAAAGSTINHMMEWGGGVDLQQLARAWPAPISRWRVRPIDLVEEQGSMKPGRSGALLTLALASHRAAGLSRPWGKSRSRRCGGLRRLLESDHALDPLRSLIWAPLKLGRWAERR